MYALHALSLPPRTQRRPPPSPKSTHPCFRPSLQSPIFTKQLWIPKEVAPSFCCPIQDPNLNSPPKKRRSQSQLVSIPIECTMYECVLCGGASVLFSSMRIGQALVVGGGFNFGRWKGWLFEWVVLSAAPCFKWWYSHSILHTPLHKPRFLFEDNPYEFTNNSIVMASLCIPYLGSFGACFLPSECCGEGSSWVLSFSGSGLLSYFIW